MRWKQMGKHVAQCEGDITKTIQNKTKTSLKLLYIMILFIWIMMLRFFFNQRMAFASLH